MKFQIEYSTEKKTYDEQQLRQLDQPFAGLILNQVEKVATDMMGDSEFLNKYKLFIEVSDKEQQVARQVN